MIQLYTNIEISEFFNAWYRFKKGKGKKYDVMAFENHLELNIFKLFEEVQSQNYTHGKYKFFQVFDSKKRSIHKATVRDRIIHEFLRFRLENKFEDKFIRDSFSSRKKKGTFKAINKFKYFLSNSDYTLSLDVKKYFNSIDHGVLLRKIKKEFEVNSIEYGLSELVIKSFGSEGKGIPLGNSVSQVFSNIYLNDFDWFVIKRNALYVRYNDDIRICFNFIERLDLKLILNYLEKNLFLQIPKNKMKISKNFNGVNFLGHLVFKNYCIIKKETKQKILKKTNIFNKNSYLGLISKHNNYNFLLKIKSMYNYIDDEKI